MKTLILTLGILLIHPAYAAENANCANVQLRGDNCSNLEVTFDLQRCADEMTSKKPMIVCKEYDASATVESSKFTYKVNLKRYVGKMNNVVWDLVGNVEKSMIVAESKPAPKRKLAQAVPTPPKSQPAVEAPTPIAPAPTQVALPAPVPTASAFQPAWKINPLLQFWYLEDTTKKSEANSTNFRLRRAEFKLTGQNSEMTRWFLVADLAKSPSTTKTKVGSDTVTTINTSGDNKVLQDLGIAVKIWGDLELIFGQFKMQTTSESMDSSSDLLFAERSLMTRTFGERRDPGILLSYKNSFVKGSLMASNGQGPNQDDKNNKKDISSRLDFYLPLGFSFGTFAVAKDSIADKLDRYGANIKFNNYGIFVRAEFANGVIGTKRGLGYVFDGAYKFLETWQITARHETIRPDIDADFKASADTIGINFVPIKQSVKFQLNHTQLKDMTGSNGSYSTSEDETGALTIFGIQCTF